MAESSNRHKNSGEVMTAEDKESWTVHDFTGIQAIGSGKFGKVFRAVERSSGVAVALKVVFKHMLEKFDFFSQMKRELEIQWRLDHPNIVKLHGYFYDAKNIYVVLDYCEHGNLYQKLRRQKCFTEEQAKHIIGQIVDALLYLQERNVIHRDIKPENILIADLEKMTVKLCDFGWATHTINERRTTFCGTVDYVAPELVYQEPYDDKIDLWAVGILTYELMTGQAPFTGRNENDTYSNITNLDLQKTDNTVRPFNSLTYEAQHFVQQVLMSDPAQRMSLAQMRNHAWLRTTLEPVAQTSLETQDGAQSALSAHDFTNSVLGTSDVLNRQVQGQAQQQTSQNDDALSTVIMPSTMQTPEIKTKLTNQTDNRVNEKQMNAACKENGQ